MFKRITFFQVREEIEAKRLNLFDEKVRYIFIVGEVVEKYINRELFGTVEGD